MQTTAAILEEEKSVFAPLRPPVIGSAVATTVVVSDIHLASPVCRANSFRAFLRDAQFQRLIILGDLFDHGDFRRLDKSHWNVLSTLRKLSSPRRGIEIVWIEGNHDHGIIRVVSHMIGARVILQHQRYMLEAGGKRLLFVHGHQFDDFMERRPVLTKVANGIYHTVQRCGGRGRRVSRWLKYKSKAWIHASDTNCEGAIGDAHDYAADVVICGHTHASLEAGIEDVHYINTGSWVDAPSHYLVITADGLSLRADRSEE